MSKLLLAAFAGLACCHSEDAAPSPAPTESVTTTKVVMANPPVTGLAPQCRIRVAGDAFAQAREDLGAHTAVAAVHVDGDYTRALAKVAIEPVPPPDGGPAVGTWSGTFNGPRDAFVDMLQRRVCTAADRVHVLLPRGGKDPSKGEVVLDVYALSPDEHRDVDNLCHAYERAPKPTAVAAGADKDAADAAARKWVEEVITSTKWDDWRKSFARERGDLFARKAQAADVAALFHTRGKDLAAAATADKLTCPTATDWNKR